MGALFVQKIGGYMYEKVKCINCGKTLLFAEHIKGEIKCPRCGSINRVDIDNTKARANKQHS